ncbi:unnamed protein product [Caretta caretta]
MDLLNQGMEFPRNETQIIPYETITVQSRRAHSQRPQASEHLCTCMNTGSDPGKEARERSGAVHSVRTRDLGLHFLQDRASGVAAMRGAPSTQTEHLTLMRRRRKRTIWRTCTARSCKTTISYMEESHEKQLGAASTTQLYAERGSLNDGILGSSKAAWSTGATEHPVK